MNNKILIAFLAAFFAILSGCQTPDELLPSVSRNGVNSIVATFEDGTGEFTGIVSAESNEIIIPVPFYFPESSNNEVSVSQLSRMRMKANLDDNVTLSPSLLYMDLTKDNVITITDQRKQRKEYIVRAEIRKSNKNLIEEFKVPSLGLTGIINEADQTISLIAIGDLEPATAEVKAVNPPDTSAA